MIFRPGPFRPFFAAWRLLALLAVLSLALTAIAGERRVREVPLAEAPYPPYLRWVPRTNAPRLDWLLVTPRDLVDAFRPLVKHRRETGLVADVVTVEDVAADALLGGGDLPERLRLLVRRLHARYGLRYLVLGADTTRLPSRMLPFPLRGSQVHYDEPYAGDAYFGCLDGEWNEDADPRFGEAEPGDDDRPDVEHEVHVGRIPVENVREVEAYVEKLLLYERPVHLDYQDRVVYLGGKVFQEDDAHRFYTGLYETLFKPHGFHARFFTRPSDGQSVGEVMKALSEGAGIVCHYHHSFTYNLSLPHGAIDTGNVQEIRNVERPFVMFSNGCYANQFTKEGISEQLLLSPKGGAIAFIGSTNTCYSSSLALERAFWTLIFAAGDATGDAATGDAATGDVARGDAATGDVATLGEALSRVRADIRPGMGSMAFLRLSFNLIGDPATRPWLGRPTRPVLDAKPSPDGTVKVSWKKPAPAGCRAACVQPGPWAAHREVVEIEEGTTTCTFPAALGNGEALSVTLFGPHLVPTTVTVADPPGVRIVDVRAAAGTLTIDLDGADDLRVPLPPDLEPGPWRIEREIEGRKLVVVVPVLDGADVAFLDGDEEVRYPGFARLELPRPDGLPLLVLGEARPVEAATDEEDDADDPLDEDLEVSVEVTDDSVRLGWQGEVGARWLVALDAPGGRRLLTPVPLVNPVFELRGLLALTKLRFVLSRLGRPGERIVLASTTFPFQAAFPQRIGSNLTSVQLLDLGGKRGKRIVFGDDALGLWALRKDGSEVRHAGDAWTFGLFAAIESGVYEPVVANLVGSKRPEILATSKLKDRKLYAFDLKGKPIEGFPVSFASRLMTPPLVGDFDGKRGNEVLVVSGFGKTIELVHPDGSKELFAKIGQYNYPYPIAVNLDRDRALEVIVLDGQGKVWALDQGGKPMKGFPVALGGPGRATPMVANLDDDKGQEIIVVAKGTTRLAVIDARTGKVQADLVIPGAGKPANDSFFYPGLARFGRKAKPSILVGTPSNKLFAFDLVGGKELRVRDGFPLDLPAEARGVAALDVDGDGKDEVFLSLFNGEVWGLTSEGTMLDGFPLRTHADTYAVPLLEDLDHDGDLELFLGAADGMLRVWDLPYRAPKKGGTWPGLLGGAGLPGTPGR